MRAWERVHPNLVGCFPCDFPLVRIEYGTESGNFVRSGKPPARSRLLETLADQVLARPLYQATPNRPTVSAKWRVQCCSFYRIADIKSMRCASKNRILLDEIVCFLYNLFDFSGHVWTFRRCFNITKFVVNLCTERL